MVISYIFMVYGYILYLYGLWLYLISLWFMVLSEGTMEKIRSDTNFALIPGPSD